MLVGFLHGGIHVQGQLRQTLDELLAGGEQVAGALGVHVVASEGADEAGFDAIDALGEAAQLHDGVVQFGVFVGHALDVAEHIARVGHHGGDFGRDVAAEDFAFSIRRQGFVFQHAGEGAQAGAADQAALQGKDAGGAQPFDVFDRHVNHDAHARVFAQAKAAHAANGKAGEGHVHADLHAFGVIRQEDEALRFFKRAAYPHQVQAGAHEQRDRGNQQQGSAHLQAALGAGLGGRGGVVIGAARVDDGQGGGAGVFGGRQVGHVVSSNCQRGRQFQSAASARTFAPAPAAPRWRARGAECRAGRCQRAAGPRQRRKGRF